MNNIETILKQLLEQNNISVSELARQTGIDQSVLFRLTSGETVNPKLDTLKPIARHFDVSIDHLIGSECLYNDKKNAKVCSLPLLTMDKIAAWLRDKNNFTNLSYLTVADLVDAHTNCYVVQILDSAMQPRFFEGTYFIFDPILQPKNGDFVAFVKGDNQKASIRQFLIDNDDKYLKAFNPDFRTIPMSQEYKLLGTAIQARINYKDLARVTS